MFSATHIMLNTLEVLLIPKFPSPKVLPTKICYPWVKGTSPYYRPNWPIWLFRYWKTHFTVVVNWNFMALKFRHFLLCLDNHWLRVCRKANNISLNLHNYFDYHVCLSIRRFPVSGGFRCHKNFFRLNHLGITPWLPGSTPGVDPGYPQGTQPLRRS